VGSLTLLMLHHLVGGAWGFAIRRPLEAATMTLPLMALLFIPIALGATRIYEWANLDAVKASEVLKLKAGFLNVPFWLGRSVFYLALWNGLAFLIRRNSVAQDATESPAPTRRNQVISAPGLVATFLSVTFAAIDWMMSIEPEWYSTIYGVMILVGWGLSAMCTVIITASWLARVKPLSEAAGATAFHDLGNLTLAFVMLWAYMSFSQYLIIWSGNLAEEVPWYLKRSYAGWRYVALALMVFHFFVPFFGLLVRENKREPARLWWIAAALLGMQLVNDTWLVVPAYHGGQAMMLLSLVPAVVGVGGLWLWLYLRNLTSRSLLPRHDPLLAETQAHGHHGGGH
jgi:hypothetical protein